MEVAEQLQGEVGDAACNQRPYGHPVEEDDSCHGADDEGGDHVRGIFQQIDPAASRQRRQQPCDDGDDASLAAEGVNHGVDGDGAIGDGHQDGSREDDDAPVDALSAQRIERRRQPQHLQQEHYTCGVDHGHIVAQVTEQQDGDDGDIFYIQ